MYKIYINEQALVLKPSSKLKTKEKNNSAVLVSKYRGQKKSLLNFIDMMEKGSSFKKVVIHADNFTQLKLDFKSLYKVVPAGGGLVVNEKDEILFIHRRGFWDLPKGKLEGEEKIKACAIREVEEETGIDGLHLITKLGKTNHQFRSGNGRRIKQSHWYLMVADKQKLIPQTEEDITRAEWMTLKKFFGKKRLVYRSILDILEVYFINEEKYKKKIKKLTMVN